MRQWREMAAAQPWLSSVPPPAELITISRPSPAFGISTSPPPTIVGLPGGHKTPRQMIQFSEAEFVRAALVATCWISLVLTSTKKGGYWLVMTMAVSLALVSQVRSRIAYRP